MTRPDMTDTTARTTPWTPGPWRIIRQTPSEGFVGWLYFVVRDSGERNPIAPATLRTEDGVVAQTTEANARLIAAAPEMAEALRHLVGYLDTVNVYTGGGKISVKGLFTVGAKPIENARALLARIGGER